MRKCAQRYISLGLMLLWMAALTGCGSDTQDVDSNETALVEQPEENVQVLSETPEDSSVEMEKTEKPVEDIESEETIETVEYSHEDIYLSIGIPDEWDYKIKTAEETAKEDGMSICAIEFWPKDYPETVFTLSYETSFGICGTGVTIEEFAWDNGLSGYRYTEEIEDTLWLTMTFTNPHHDTDDGDIKSGVYCLMASPALAVWDTVQPEFEEIVKSIWVGSH